MRVLLDTNVLLRLGNTAVASTELDQLVQHLLEAGAHLCICQQNVVEFWTAATLSADANGFAWSVGAAHSAVARMLESFQLLPDPADLLTRWLALCTRSEVLGRQAYDARLVALMQAHGIERLVTLNPIDFRRYGVSLITPTS